MTLSALLRVGLVLQIGIPAAVLAWLLPSHWTWLALPIAFLVAPAGTAVTLALEFALGAVVDPRTPALPLRNRIAIWWRETAISTRMFAFTQLVASRFVDPPLVRDPRRPAVLLVHGYLCNHAVWRAMLESGALNDCNVATVDLEPIFGPIERYAEVVAGAVERLRRAGGAAQVVLVGHSMGGLAIRAYLSRFGDAAVARVVTLATPHHGTVLALFGSGANAKQMRVGSVYLQQLAGALSPALAARFVCVATRDDNMIVPRSSPLLPGAQHVVVERVGHLALIEDARAWQVVRQVAQGAPPADSTPRPQPVIDSAT
ncbi:MAG TPA: alpha/beta fold hydrolase [Burkholderiaceae bacterium]|nr:alpha/beta fold hydrolase [Burkholderiaceae bacterium]